MDTADTGSETGARLDKHVTRRLAIGNYRVLVLDGLFPEKEIVSLYELLRELPYRLSGVDTAGTEHVPHWDSKIPIPLALSTAVFKQCIEAAARLMASSPASLTRVHANLHLYGDMQFPHTDLPGGVTGLYFANPDWDEQWFGETVFYDEHREPLYTVAPRPGRLVLFHGDILHRGGVPSRTCFPPRITLAFKFARPDS